MRGYAERLKMARGHVSRWRRNKQNSAILIESRDLLGVEYFRDIPEKIKELLEKNKDLQVFKDYEYIKMPRTVQKNVSQRKTIRGVLYFDKKYIGKKVRAIKYGD